MKCTKAEKTVTPSRLIAVMEKIFGKVGHVSVPHIVNEGVFGGTGYTVAQ